MSCCTSSCSKLEADPFACPTSFFSVACTLCLLLQPLRFNNVTYPNFLAFLQHMKIPYEASDMSFSVSRDQGLFEWAGGSLGQLFAQKINLLNPGQWRMVWDILRFNTGALELLRKGDETESIGSYLAREGYSQAFVDNYLLVRIFSLRPIKQARP